MTRCPIHDAEVPTVYRMSHAQFDALEGEYAFRCRLCGDVHRWRREAAWVEALAPEVEKAVIRDSL